RRARRDLVPSGTGAEQRTTDRDRGAGPRRRRRPDPHWSGRPARRRRLALPGRRRPGAARRRPTSARPAVTDRTACRSRRQSPVMTDRTPADRGVVAAAGLPGWPGRLRIGPATFEWGSRTFVMGILNVTPDSFSGD